MKSWPGPHPVQPTVLLYNLQEGERAEVIHRYLTGVAIRITGTATHSDTGEIMMAYQPLYDGHGMYVRPLDMFLSGVDHGKYPQIKQKYRFQKCEE